MALGPFEEEQAEMNETGKQNSAFLKKAHFAFFTEKTERTG